MSTNASTTASTPNDRALLNQADAMLRPGEPRTAEHSIAVNTHRHLGHQRKRSR